MSVKCPKCQSDNPDTAAFCADCGTRIISPRDIDVTETIEASKEELSTGSTFAERYQIIEELGKGGMGRVYKVLDKEVNAKVALKLIKSEIASDKKTIERFRNELKVARDIAHKNVCRMYDLGKEEGAYYITMEYVSGEDLKSFIRRSGIISVGKAISIANQVCEGLLEAHRLGVVHRDLKPQNIMIDKDGNARIMDFGIARSLRAKGITGSGVMIGTPEYMSPEQVDGKEADHRADIYSLGVILYEMVTGRVPFEGDTPFSIGVKQKSEIPRSPREINEHIPDDLNNIILKCMEKDKEKRFQSVSELQSELMSLEKDIPTTERIAPERKPITSKEITVTFGMKKVLFPAIAVVVIAIVALFFLWKRGSNLDPNLVAVAIFENQTGNQGLDYLGRMTADLISQGLRETNFFEIVPTSTVETTSGEFKQGDLIDFLANRTSAGRVISGTYYLSGEDLQFQSQVTDTQNKKILYALDPISGTSDDPDKTIRLLQQKTMGLMVMALDKNDKDMLQFGIRPTYESYKEYKLGVETFYRGEQERSITHFNKAMTLDPDFKFPLWWIAAFYRNYGRNKELENLINRTLKMRDTLDPITETLVIDYAGAGLRGDKQGEYQAIKRAADLHKTLMLNYLVALSSNRMNRPKEALSWLKPLDQKSPYIKNWGGYWGNLTKAYHTLGQHEQELKEARKGLEYNPERRSFLFYKLRALMGLGNIDQIYEELENSLTYPPRISWSHGRLLFEAAKGLRAHGYREESIQIFNRALDWFEDRPQEEKTSRSHRGCMELLE